MRATSFIYTLLLAFCVAAQLAHGKKPIESDTVKFDFKTQGPRTVLGAARLARVAENAGKSISKVSKLLRDDDDLVSLAVSTHPLVNPA
jgi:hypothetical protein